MYRVVAAHDAEFPAPLFVRAGEVLSVEDRQTEWAGWLWCTIRAGKGGWVPERYVERQGERATALRDYDATELSVQVGEWVVAGEVESGWVWCTTADGKSGWVPVDHLERRYSDESSTLP